MTDLRVNGQQRAYSGDPTMPLLWYLRDELQMTGTKFGCGVGLCGACTVHINGEAVRACQVQMSETAGKAITTIEGLGKGGELHPVQEALIAEQAAQCGYCMSGIAVAAAALLSTNASPSESEIRQALDKHLCRCGSHNRVVRAVKKASEQARR